MNVQHTNSVSADVWRQAILPVDATMQQAIRNLDDVAIRIVLVVDSAGVLVGTVADGDIRRGLLRGLDLNSPLTSVLHRNPLVVTPNVARATVQQLMQANDCQQIPIVDEHQHLVGLHLWSQMNAPAVRPNLMVIMAGGLGTRLRPQTESLPKPLLPVAGKPMLEHIIARARLQGFSHFILAVHYLGHLIEDYFGNGERLQVQIDYLREQSALGTAGALSLLDPHPPAPFVVTNCDVITDIDYGALLDFHIRQGATATMAVRLHEWQHPFGVVQTNGVDIVGFEEKPIARSHINAGVYVLSAEALSVLHQNTACDMPVLFERLQAQAKRTVAFPMHEPWLDVGRPEDLNPGPGIFNRSARARSDQ